MLRNSSLFAIAISVGMLSGCVVRGRAQVGATAYVEEPELVYVSPGVYVVAEQEEPVFYSDNYYWLYRGGVWYRSSVYSGGWVRYSYAPVRLRTVRPHAYIRVRATGGGHGRARGHYRNPGRARGHYNARDNRGGGGPAVRDHRAPAKRRGPKVRDHRDD